MKYAALAVVCLAGVASESTVHSALIPIDPAATYLRTSGDPDAHNTVPISLATLGLIPGMQIHVQELGLYTTDPIAQPSEIFFFTEAVFSSSNSLLASNILNRVSGAIAAGTPYVTGPNFVGSLPNDIPEDFAITLDSSKGVNVVIPTGAAYLFVAAEDSFWGGGTHSNADFNSDYGVEITVVPEPTSATMLSLPFTFLLLRRKKILHVDT